MKAILLLSIIIASAFASSLQAKMFLDWAREHKKTYSNANELQYRMQVFSDNLKRIDALNAKYGNRTRFGMNLFGDLTVEEFKQGHHNAGPFVQKPEWPVAKPTLTGTLPASWDWRSKGAVSSVNDQGQCGCCWAESTVGNVEGQWFLKTGKLPKLSVQNLIDCDHECMNYQNQQSCDSGCEGGLMPNAFQYIMKNGGIDTEASYSFEGVDDTCRFNNKTIGAKISNWTMVSGNEDDMAAYLVQNGPISVAVAADEFQFYIGGVFYIPCDTQLDHGVLIVGYGVETDIFFQTMPYWIIKNSWSASWGENGYIRLERGVGKCGVNLFPCSAIA